MTTRALYRPGHDVPPDDPILKDAVREYMQDLLEMQGIRSTGGALAEETFVGNANPPESYDPIWGSAPSGPLDDLLPAPQPLAPRPRENYWPRAPGRSQPTSERLEPIEALRRGQR